MVHVHVRFQRRFVFSGERTLTAVVFFGVFFVHVAPIYVSFQKRLRFGFVRTLCTVDDFVFGMFYNFWGLGGFLVFEVS